MPATKISLAIYGSHTSGAGWQLLCSLNQPPFLPLTEDPMVGFANDVPYCYTIRIDAHYVMYSLEYNPRFINAHGSNRAGALNIVISIPKGYKISGSASACNVLLDINNALKQYALSPILGMENGFKYREQFPSAEVFQKVLDAYQLEPCNMPYRQMSTDPKAPKAAVIAGEDRVELLMHDVQYPVFQQYSKIIFAPRTALSTHLNIEIPRPREFKIYVQVDNRVSRPYYSNGKSVFGLNDFICIDGYEFSGLNKETYEVASVSATVSNLLAGITGSQSVTVIKNEVTEEIHLSFKSKERTKKLMLVLEGVDNDTSVINNLRFKILSNNGSRPLECKHDKTTNSHFLVLKGDDISRAFTIDFDFFHKKYRKHSGAPVSVQGDKLVVRLEKIQETPNVRVSGTIISGSSGSSVVPNNESQITTVLVKLPEELKSCDYVSLRFHSTSRSFCINKNVRDGKVEFEIPKSWGGTYTLSFKANGFKYSGEHNLQRYNSEFCEVDVKCCEKLTWHDKLAKYRRWLFVVLLLLAVVMSFCAGRVFFHSDKSTNGQTNDSTTTTVVNPIVTTEAEWQTQADKIKTHLDDSEYMMSTPFSELRSELNFVSENVDIANSDEQKYKDLIALAQEYTKLLDALEPDKISLNSIQGAIKKDCPEDLKTGVLKNVRLTVASMYNQRDDLNKLGDAKVKKVNEWLRQNPPKSFKEIKNFDEMYTLARQTSNTNGAGNTGGNQDNYFGSKGKF